MKDQAILANSGHFNVEIDIPALEKMAVDKTDVQNNVAEYKLTRRKTAVPPGRRPADQPGGGLWPSTRGHGYVLRQSGTGRALHRGAWAKAGEESVRSACRDRRRVAELKLASMGLKTEKLTPEQDKYLHSWQTGTK